MIGIMVFLAEELASSPQDIGLPDITVSTGVSTILNIVFFMAAILAVIFIIVGGFQYTLSGGDAPGIKKAKETITYAIVGLIVTLLAFGIINFVTNIKG